VFDWAGTTVDFGSVAPVSAVMAAFAARGVAVTAAQARGPMGLSKMEHVRAVLRMPEVSAGWRAVHGREWTEADVADVYGAATPFLVKAAAERATLVPGVLECVAELRRRGVRIGSTTGYFRAAAEACYARAAAQGYAPDVCVCPDDVPAGRPDPAMIRRCMGALGIDSPAAVVKVGDTLVDVAEGLNAGCRAVGVVDSSSLMGRSEEEFAALSGADRAARRAAVRAQFLAAGAHGVVNSLAELPAWLDKNSDLELR